MSKYITKIIKFTSVELDQLKSYIEWAEENGTYYGNKEQFWKRHEQIKMKFFGDNGE